AVAANTDGQASAVAQGQRGADGDARPRADAATTILADEVERMPERPQLTVPGERQMQQRDLASLGGSAQPVSQLRDSQTARQHRGNRERAGIDLWLRRSSLQRVE